MRLMFLKIWLASFAVMRRTYERGTKARLSFSGGLQYERSECRWKKKRRKRQVCCAVLHYISCAKLSQILEVLRDLHRLFGSRNRPTTSILYTIRHVYRSVWPAREAKRQRSYKCSAHIIGVRSVIV